jgi:hypothetical protein
MRHALAARLSAAALLSGLLLAPAPAHADARVSIANSDGDAKVDPTYATRLRVSGNGFQSIKNGHGGIYVFFGAVTPGWQPSKGGSTGQDYFYVPDSEARNNQGFQKYVAFPGSDTASSANGGTMSASGDWSTSLVVPGAVFQAYDRSGAVRTIDCRTVTCGVITVGAHGVTNSHNETFTPVSVGDLTGPGSTPSATTSPSADSTATPTEQPSTGASPTATGPATLEVDRVAAVAGHVLAFTAIGLPAGAQVSAVFDDGEAGAGPFAVGADGQLSGVIGLPASTGAGTHELRLYGVDDPPSVSFAVRPADEPAAADVEPQSADDDSRAARLFAGASGVVLLVALARLGRRVLRSRRAAA